MVATKCGLRCIEGNALGDDISFGIESDLGVRVYEAFDQPDGGKLVDLKNIPGGKYGISVL
jgi:hypothetical protein